jgi:hypothetical protein
LQPKNGYWTSTTTVSRKASFSVISTNMAATSLGFQYPKNECYKPASIREYLSQTSRRIAIVSVA